MVGILFLKVQKSILFCLLSLSAIYFTIRGFQQVTKEQISTKTEYRYGDDNVQQGLQAADGGGAARRRAAATHTTNGRRW